MSPIVARIAFRQAAANVSRRQVAATAAKPRQFSVIHSLRSFARSFEPHPFERLPVSSNAQAGDWGKQVRRVGTQVAIFVPAFTLMLGWPAIGRAVLDDRV